MPAADNDRGPHHVAIIMDGNGRWARARGLPRVEGHRAGAESVRRVVEACSEHGISYLTLYAFSTENWRRPRQEISQLMHLLQRFLRERRKDLHKHDIRLHAIGDLDRLPKYARKELDKVIAETRDHGAGTLTLALNYGSRHEIAGAAATLAEQARQGTLNPDDITEDLFAASLNTAGLPDPDLIIRTSGELRLSNFLLWQSAYSEFWFTKTLWPDFSKKEFAAALADFRQRKRRYGGRENDA